MGRLARKLRLSAVFGLSAWTSMVAFGFVRILGRLAPWNRWLEFNDFLDTLVDRGGTVERRDGRVVVEQGLALLGGRLRAELRPGTSDLPTWVQIVGQEDYAIVERLLRQRSGRPIRTIVDAGANIGLASLYFAEAFPECRILAVEPDPDNFEILVLNVRSLKDRVECVRAAFWPVDEPLQMDPEPFRGGREWARTVRRVEEPVEGGGASTVPVVTPPEAVARLGGGPVDLLKMDIEGAEAEFFADVDRCRNLLTQTRAIAIEVHPERIDPHRVLYALDEAGFLVVPSHDFLFGIRRSRRVPQPGLEGEQCP
jgi:FkbM family methyltransferase